MDLIVVLVVGVVSLIALLVGRELVAWYFKVNEALGRLANLEAVLRNIDKNIGALVDIESEKQGPRS